MELGKIGQSITAVSHMIIVHVLDAFTFSLPLLPLSHLPFYAPSPLTPSSPLSPPLLRSLPSLTSPSPPLSPPLLHSFPHPPSSLLPLSHLPFYTPSPSPSSLLPLSHLPFYTPSPIPPPPPPPRFPATVRKCSRKSSTQLSTGPLSELRVHIVQFIGQF